MQPKKRSTSTYTGFVSAAPDKVFPLLCPVREYDWIEGWPGKLVYSDTGVAECDCVFTTPFENDTETWTCSRYEPPCRIDYVRMSPHRVVRLELRLQQAGAGTRVTVSHVITALDPAGEELVGACDAGTSEAQFKPLFIMLDHYLKTGTMLARRQAASA